MKKTFVKVKNVRDFASAMTRLKNAQAGIPRMALLSGKFGLGRTETAMWWTAQNDDVKFIRVVSLISGPWLLSKIIAELGQAPERRISDRFDQLINILLDKPQTLIFDEIDYLCRDTTALETLRDIHDIAGTVIVFVGMENADKKLMRHPHLWDRLTERIKFDDLTHEDLRLIAQEKCEVELSDDAITYLHSQGANRFRPLMIGLYKAEAIARANSLKKITAADLSRGKK